jgi:hypothetical protein
MRVRRRSAMLGKKRMSAICRAYSQVITPTTRSLSERHGARLRTERVIDDDEADNSASPSRMFPPAPGGQP